MPQMNIPTDASSQRGSGRTLRDGARCVRRASKETGTTFRPRLNSKSSALRIIGILHFADRVRSIVM
jgi:hypothetical protein